MPHYQLKLPGTLPWGTLIPSHVFDEPVKKRYEPLENAMRKGKGFEEIQTTTRVVTLTLEEGVTPNAIQFQITLFRFHVLVCVPRCSPVYPWYKRIRHLQKQGCTRICPSMSHVAASRQCLNNTMHLDDTQSTGLGAPFLVTAQDVARVVSLSPAAAIERVMPSLVASAHIA